MPTTPTVDANKINSAVSGEIFVAATSTTLPTDASTALGSAFKSLGYLSADGLRVTENRETVSWDAWGAFDVRKSMSKHEVTAEFAPMELNGEVCKLIFGSANVTMDTTDTTMVKSIAAKGQDIAEVAAVCETKLLNGNKLRIVFPRLKITNTGTLNFEPTNPISSSLEASALPDSNGMKFAAYQAAASA